MSPTFVLPFTGIHCLLILRRKVKGTLMAPIVVSVCGGGYLIGNHCQFSQRGRVLYWHPLSSQSAGKGTFLAPIVVSVCCGRVGYWHPLSSQSAGGGYLTGTHCLLSLLEKVSYWHLFPTQSMGEDMLLAPVVVSVFWGRVLWCLNGPHIRLSLLQEGACI